VNAGKRRRRPRLYGCGAVTPELLALFELDVRPEGTSCHGSPRVASTSLGCHSAALEIHKNLKPGMLEPSVAQRDKQARGVN
jgi:hypothetical protein